MSRTGLTVAGQLGAVREPDDPNPYGQTYPPLPTCCSKCSRDVGPMPLIRGDLLLMALDALHSKMRVAKRACAKRLDQHAADWIYDPTNHHEVEGVHKFLAANSKRIGVCQFDVRTIVGVPESCADHALCNFLSAIASERITKKDLGV